MPATLQSTESHACPSQPLSQWQAWKLRPSVFSTQPPWALHQSCIAPLRTEAQRAAHGSRSQRWWRAARRGTQRRRAAASYSDYAWRRLLEPELPRVPAAGDPAAWRRRPSRRSAWAAGVAGWLLLLLARGVNPPCCVSSAARQNGSRVSESLAGIHWVLTPRRSDNRTRHVPAVRAGGKNTHPPLENVTARECNGCNAWEKTDATATECNGCNTRGK